MGTIITARIDEEIKARASAIMKRQGYTPSAAVQQLFEYTVKHDALPFEDGSRPSEEEIHRMVKALDACHTKHALDLTNEELREDRLRNMHGSGAR